jgi:shikimate dehydrogenase
VRHEEGYHGHNSDGYGLAAALRTDLGAALEGATVILLGAGGAARAAAVQCLLDGCAALWIGNRNQDRLAGLLRQIETAGMPGAVRGFDLSDPPDDLPRSGILINATSVGLKPEDPAPIGLERFEPALKVYDMIYNPAETSLLRRARALGMPAANGLSMLVWQGVRSLEIWSGAKVPATAMDAAARAALGRA